MYKSDIAHRPERLPQCSKGSLGSSSGMVIYIYYTIYIHILDLLSTVYMFRVNPSNVLRTGPHDSPSAARAALAAVLAEYIYYTIYIHILDLLSTVYIYRDMYKSDIAHRPERLPQCGKVGLGSSSARRAARRTRGEAVRSFGLWGISEGGRD